MAPDADSGGRRPAGDAPASPSVFDEPTPPPGRRRVLDGAAFGLYEDDEPERRVPVVAVSLVAVLAIAVGGLVWWAVQADARLDPPPEDATSTTTTPELSTGPPSTAELLLLVPADLTGCQPASDPAAEGPPRATVRCPGPDGLADVQLSLFPSVVDRDDAFDFLAGLLGADGAGDEECALGQFGRHDYLGVQQVGELACGAGDGRIDLVWTSDTAPVLGVATADGSYAAAYDAWADLVDRTDAAFPAGQERALLDQLPDSLLGDCRRDVDLALASGAELAIRCRPERSPAADVSWLRFASGPAGPDWLAARRDTLPGPVVEGADACTPDGFGRNDGAGIDDASTTTAAPEVVSAGAGRYEHAGSTGSVLCHLDDAGRATVAWLRDGSFGSVALAGDGVGMPELLAWWQAGGHLP